MYQGVAYRTAYLITGDAGEAEDATQVGLVKAYRALDRFDRSRPFRPWLLRIVANEARNRRRSAARRLSLHLAAGREREETAAISPEAEALGRERREALLAAMNRLGQADREVVAMRYFLDLSEADMAEVLGVAPGTVKSRLSRALGRLREALAGSLQGGWPDG